MQPNLPITIKTTDDQYIAQFHVGDRVTFRDGDRTNLDHEREIGLIVEVSEVVFVVLWGDHKYYCNYTKDHIKRNQWWIKSIEDAFLENSNHVDSFPEISTKSKTQGYVEHYFVTGKNKKCYWYTRYVYQDISGKLRHHHIPKKQKEAIAAMWRDGASEKDICTALGKSFKSK
jgi:hypothetical protein